MGFGGFLEDNGTPKWLTRRSQDPPADRRTPAGAHPGPQRCMKSWRKHIRRNSVAGCSNGFLKQAVLIIVFLAHPGRRTQKKGKRLERVEFSQTQKQQQNTPDQPPLTSTWTSLWSHGPANHHVSVFALGLSRQQGFNSFRRETNARCTGGGDSKQQFQIPRGRKRERI